MAGLRWVFGFFGVLSSLFVLLLESVEFSVSEGELELADLVELVSVSLVLVDDFLDSFDFIFCEGDFLAYLGCLFDFSGSLFELAVLVEPVEFVFLERELELGDSVPLLLDDSLAD